MPESLSGPKNISVADAYTYLGTEGHALVDVRTEDEVYELGIQGALAIPLDQLEMRTQELAGYTSVSVICYSGGRSAVGAHLLHDLGVPHVMNVMGGIIAWKEASLPTI